MNAFLVLVFLQTALIAPINLEINFSIANAIRQQIISWESIVKILPHNKLVVFTSINSLIYEMKFFFHSSTTYIYIHYLLFIYFF